MEIFYPGDQIEFIDDKTQGTVVAIINHEQILIDIEGLVIPTFTSQVIKISKSGNKIISLEEKYKDDTNKKNIETKPSANEIKIVLLDSESYEYHSLVIINDTHNTLLFTAYGEQNDEVFFNIKAELKPSAKTLLYNIKLKKNSDNQKITLCLLMHHEKSKSVIKPVVYSFLINDKTFLRKKEMIHELGKHGIVFRVNSVAPVEFKNVRLEKPDTPAEHKIDMIKPSHTVDLHIDKICDDFSKMTRSEIFNYQFDYFVNSLEKGHSFGFKKMIFIHGIGVSSLKNRIYQYLKSLDYVSSFSEADVRKYGFGAVEISFMK